MLKMRQVKASTGYTFETTEPVRNRYSLNEITEWCHEQFGPEFVGEYWWNCNCANRDYGFVNFYEATPAMLFKMRWC